MIRIPRPRSAQQLWTIVGGVLLVVAAAAGVFLFATNNIPASTTNGSQRRHLKIVQAAMQKLHDPTAAALQPLRVTLVEAKPASCGEVDPSLYTTSCDTSATITTKSPPLAAPVMADRLLAAHNTLRQLGWQLSTSDFRRQTNLALEQWPAYLAEHGVTVSYTHSRGCNLEFFLSTGKASETTPTNALICSSYEPV